MSFTSRGAISGSEGVGMDTDLMQESDLKNEARTRARAWSRSSRGRKGSRELADLGVIASGLAHEIRNPLNTMRIQATVISRRLSRGDPSDLAVARQQLSALQDEVVRIEKLADAFLAYGRPPTGEPERIRLAEFLRKLVGLLAPECESRNIHLALQISKPGQAAAVFMDRSQLEQVLLNLTRNANKAMEHGGVLTIRLRKLRGKRVGVDVIDTGCGIPRDKLTTIFEPFFSTRHDGSGLGLAIARQIIESAGGYIRVDSEVDRGSCFEVVLTLAPEEPAEHF